jgi:hypothetical protein
MTIYIQFSDCGEHIRKWSREPFDGGAAYVEGPVWLPIESAPKDRTTIWAVLRDDIYPGINPQREDLERWNGLQVPLRHPGLTDDGFDMGWSIAAPVGNGGFPDHWIAGWMPLPAPRAEGGK